MKTRNAMFNIIAMLCVGMMFTSCHKDEKIAMKLSGEWEGNWGMYYVDSELGRFDSYQSTVTFIPDQNYDTKGTGYQIDWYSRERNEQGNESRYEKMFYEFRWYVEHKAIILTYPGHPELNSRIREYTLKKNHFTGYFNNSKTEFDLYSVWKYYNWSDYAKLNMYTAGEALCWTWTGLEVLAIVTGNNGYYYGKTRNATNDSIPLPVVEGSTITIGNRFAEE